MDWLEKGFVTKPTQPMLDLLTNEITDAFGLTDEIKYVGHGYHTVVYSDGLIAYAVTRWVEGFQYSQLASELFPSFNVPEVFEIKPHKNFWVITMELIQGKALSSCPMSNDTKTLEEYGSMLVQGSSERIDGTGWGVEQKHVSILDAFQNDLSWTCACNGMICERTNTVTADMAKALQIVESYDYSWAESLKSWVHGDSHLQNVLKTKDGQLHVIDWSHLSVLPKPLELISLQRQARFWDYKEERLARIALRSHIATKAAYKYLVELYDETKVRELIAIGSLANMLGEIARDEHVGNQPRVENVLGMQYALGAYENKMFMTEFVYQDSFRN